jgi:glycosyltransferase involved in cell wall biosynthesis
LNFSDTALDKSALEAMAAGVPVLSTNACVAEALPEALHATLMCPREDVEAQAQRIDWCLSLSEQDRTRLSDELREVVVRDHGLSTFWDRAFSAMGGSAR